MKGKKNLRETLYQGWLALIRSEKDVWEQMSNQEQHEQLFYLAGYADGASYLLGVSREILLNQWAIRIKQELHGYNIPPYKSEMIPYNGWDSWLNFFVDKE